MKSCELKLNLKFNTREFYETSVFLSQLISSVSYYSVKALLNIKNQYRLKH